MMQGGGLNRARGTRPAFGRPLILASLESRTGWYGRLDHVTLLFEPLVLKVRGTRSTLR